MNERAIIIHGYTGYPDKNWFPWLKQELIAKGFSVEVPAMPHTKAPQLTEWLPYLQELIGQPEENTYLVGHSLGCIAILRYLESLPAGTQVGGAVLVAGFSEPIHIAKLDNFFQPPLDYEKCRAAAKAITLINSDDDEHVPLDRAKVMEAKLGAKLIVCQRCGHLNEKAGFTKLPLALSELLAMTQAVATKP